MSAMCGGDGPGARMVEINRLLSAGASASVSDEDLKRMPKYAESRRWGEYALRPELAAACCLVAAGRGLAEVPRRYLRAAAKRGAAGAVDAICREAAREAPLKSAVSLGSSFGARLLGAAVDRGSGDVVRCLVGHGAPRDSDRLISQAIRKGSAEMIITICTANLAFQSNREAFLREASAAAARRKQPGIFRAAEMVAYGPGVDRSARLGELELR